MMLPVLSYFRIPGWTHGPKMPALGEAGLDLPDWQRLHAGPGEGLHGPGLATDAGWPGGPGLPQPGQNGMAVNAMAIAVDLLDPIDMRIAALTSPATTAGTASLTAPVLTDYSSGRSAGLYNVNIHFQGSWTADLQQAFIRAVDVIESIIRDDLPAVYVRTPAGRVMVDDIIINATLNSVDGVGGVLGQAGPTAIRGISFLPAMAEMTFDEADARALLATTETMTSADGTHAQTQWDAVVQHEMLHSIGLGSLWSMKDLTSGGVYVGKAAALEYARMLDPAATTGVPVPLETTGGSGTAGSHWSEAAFNTELMTGYLDQAYAPLSTMSAHALADLGYGLDLASNWKVEPYALV